MGTTCITKKTIDAKFNAENESEKTLLSDNTKKTVQKAIVNQLSIISYFFKKNISFLF